MKMQDVLLEERLSLGMLPCYDKDPSVPSYVIDGNNCVSYDQFPSYTVDGEKVLTIPGYHRVHVPMSEPQDIERKVLALVKAAAEHGSVGVESTGSPPRVLGCYAVVIKPPGLVLDVDNTVEVIEHPGVGDDRFYCLVEPQYLGRRPVRHDTLGNVSEMGFLIYNPDGIRTVFLETRQKAVEIHAQA